MGLTYNIGNSWTKVAYTLFGNRTVRGIEAVPPRGRLIIVANHQSNADPPLIAASIPRRVAFYGKQGLFRGPIASYLLKSIGVYPLSRDGHDSAAALWGLELLNQERALCVFPESTRCRLGMRRGLPGAVWLAVKTQAPILPIGIEGTEKMSSLMRVPFPFCRVSLQIGDPFTLPVVEGKIPKPQILELTDMIMERVAQLLSPKYRGYYSNERIAERAAQVASNAKARKIQEMKRGPTS